MSYATMQDVLFDLDRFCVAKPAEATPRRARDRSRITGEAVSVALRGRARSSGQAQGSRPDESRRAARAIS
jgi:hypothetical protein